MLLMNVRGCMVFLFSTKILLLLIFSLSLHDQTLQRKTPKEEVLIL